MINFNKIVGPGGIRVYHQRLPGVKSVSIRWIMFVGGADDTVVGAPGIFHWFEHVPFRGTKKFPEGSKTRAGITRHGGKIGADTSHERTHYHAHTPLAEWRNAFEFVTDLMCQPLLREEDVDGERTIIHQEIMDANSDSSKILWQKMRPITWRGHPFQYDVLGSEKTLDSMSPDLLRKAHEHYSRSRCTLIIAGDISEAEVMDALNQVLDVIPDRPLSERHGPMSYGPMQVLQGGTTEFENPLPGSRVVMIFSKPGFRVSQGLSSMLPWTKLQGLFSCGGMEAPLMRTVRLERKLVYSTGAFDVSYVDGGHWGLQASSKPKNIPLIIEAFYDVLRLPELRGNERHEYTNDNIRGGAAMSVVNPSTYTLSVLEQLMDFGNVISEEEWINMYTSVSPHETNAILDTLTAECAHLFVLQGKG